jgi:hypothetical protein
LGRTDACLKPVFIAPPLVLEILILLSKLFKISEAGNGYAASSILLEQVTGFLLVQCI